jgi:hypothetical protein
LFYEPGDWRKARHGVWLVHPRDRVRTRMTARPQRLFSSPGLSAKLLPLHIHLSTSVHSNLLGQQPIHILPTPSTSTPTPLFAMGFEKGTFHHRTHPTSPAVLRIATSHLHRIEPRRFEQCHHTAAGASLRHGNGQIRS